MKSTTIITLAMVLLLSSCTKENEWVRGNGSTETKFSVASIGGYNDGDEGKETRSELLQPITSDTIDLGEEYAILAETFDIPNTNFENQDDAATRGIPVQEATQITSMNIMAFNSGSSSFTSSTPLSSLITSKLSNGNWNNDKSFLWAMPENRISFFALSPAATSENGMIISDDGRMLTYNAPDVTSKQPDICWATPILNRQNPENSGNHLVQFYFKHRLAAIGLMGMGSYLKINKVTVSNVMSSGKLNIQDGNWTEIGGKKSFDIGVMESISNLTMADITKSDGYVMLPPQSLNNDAMLTFVFDDTKNNKTNITKTIRLKSQTITNWGAAQIILYKVIFKGSYPITVTPASLSFGTAAGSNTLNYSTTSPMPVTVDTDVPWVTNLQLASGNKITFNYTTTSAGSPRSGNIYVSTGYTTVKVPISQVAPDIQILGTIKNPINYKVATYYTIIKSTAAWKVSGTTNTSVTPNSGSAGTHSIQITVTENPKYRTSRTCDVTFTTTAGYDDKTTKWSTTQQNKYPDGYYPDPVTIFRNPFITRYEITFLSEREYFWISSQYEYARDVFCPGVGGKVISVSEAQKVIQKKHLYPNINKIGPSYDLWTRDDAGKSWFGQQQYVVNVGSSGTSKLLRKSLSIPRCVKSIVEKD